MNPDNHNKLRESEKSTSKRWLCFFDRLVKPTLVGLMSRWVTPASSRYCAAESRSSGAKTHPRGNQRLLRRLSQRSDRRPDRWGRL